MGKYSSGMTFGDICNHEKEEIKHALNDEILASWNEQGKHWKKGTKEQTDKVILDTYDELYYQAERLREAVCVIKKIHDDFTADEFSKYLQYTEEEHNNIYKNLKNKYHK